jgi:YVTN family beta-propeller protein
MILRCRVVLFAGLVVWSTLDPGFAQELTSRSLAAEAGVPVNRIVATIPLGSNVYPTGMVVSPDSESVYVTDFTNTNGMVTVINTATNTVKSTITIGSEPHALTITSDGKALYAANDSTVYVVSTVSGTVTTTLSVSLPMGLTASPDGKKIYVCTPFQNSVSIIDTANNQLIPNAIKAGGDEIVITPNGNFGYLISENDIFVIDLANEQVTTTIQLPLKARRAIPGFLTMSPKGNKLFINTRRSIWVVDTNANQMIGRIAMPYSGGYQGQPGITLDGKFLYEPFTGADDVLMVNTVSNEIAGNQINVHAPQAVAVAPDGHRAYIMATSLTGNESFEGRVYVVDIRPD